MSALADVFAAVRLQLDGTGFEAQATALADKQGKNVGDRMSANLSSKLKAAAGGAIGAAAGAAFGIALVGANELDAATRQLQADTGMTAAEAKKAEHALAGMYRNNLQGFDAIGAAMAKVHSDLGLTGEAADALTAQFLKFGTATGQDASAAVSDFDDILDAWNLTAEDTASVMDKLIVSQQKYGGSLTENQSALADMAPAMQSMNMTVDDGIALLNLLALSGIDAAKATTMLRSAVKNLKPGQDINDLIAQVEAIEDPVLRGQKAMELFGAKTGIAMAQAIKPGMKSLADLTASLGDTTGATTKAAAAVESGFGAQFQMILKNAGGALAEFGTQFGPLLMVASAFGPKLVTGLGATLGTGLALVGTKIVAAIGAWTVPTTVAAETVGSTAGGAFSASFLAAAAIPLTLLAVPLASIGVQLANLKDKSEQVQDVWLAGKGGAFRVVPELTADLKDAGAATGDLASRMSRVAASGSPISQFGRTAATAVGKVTSAADRMGLKFRDNALAVKNAARSLALYLAGVAQDLISGYYEPIIEQQDLLAAKNEVEENRLAVAAAKRALALTKAGSAARAAAQRDLDAARAAYTKSQETYDQARLNMLGAGTLSAKAQSEWLKDLKTRWKTATGTTKTYIGNLIAAIEKLQRVGREGVSIKILPMIARGGRVGVSAGGNALEAGQPSWVGERGRELWVPTTPGVVIPHNVSEAMIAGKGMGGGTANTTTMNLTVNVTPGADTSLGTARRFGQAVLDEVAYGLREQRARTGAF